MWHTFISRFVLVRLNDIDQLTSGLQLKSHAYLFKPEIESEEEESKMSIAAASIAYVSTLFGLS